MTAINHPIAQQEWFQQCPLGLLALNAEGRICGVNVALEELTGLGVAHLLGHSRESLPSPSHKELFTADALIHINGAGLPVRWLQCRSRSQSWPDGESLTLHYYQDMTETHRLLRENEALRQRVEELAVTDELTGMANHRTLMQMLSTQVSRSRRYQNPLTIGLVEIDLSDAEGPASAAVPDELVLAVSCYLRDRLRWADVIGRWSTHQFMLVLPETPAGAAHKLIENIACEVSEVISPEEVAGMAFSLRFGLAEWQKGYDVQRLLEQVENAAAGAEAIVASSGR